MLRLHIVLLFELLDDSCGQRLVGIERRFEFRGEALVRLHIVGVDDDIEVSEMIATQGVLLIDECILHAWRGDSLTAVQLTWEEIFTIGILQLFTDAADGHGFHVINEHLRIARSIATIGIKMLPGLMGIGEILHHLVLLIIGTIRLLGVSPIDHLHVVGVEVIEEHGLGRGVAHLSHEAAKTVNSEGVAIGSTRCLTFIRASSHHGHRTYNNERKTTIHHSAF